MNRAAQGLLQFADEPLLHWSIRVTMAGESGHKTNGGESPLGDIRAIGIATKNFSFRRVAVEIQNSGRVGHALGANDIQIDWIALAPLHLQQLAGKLRVVVFFSEQRRLREQFAIGQGK